MEITLDQLKDHFDSEYKPYWKVFDGRTNRGTPIKSNLSVENIEESWQILDDFMSWCTGGVVTISFHTSPQAKPSSAITVNVGGESSGGSRQSPVRSSPVSHLKEMMEFMMLMDRYKGAGQVSPEEMRRQIRMEFEFEQMREMLEAGPDNPRDLALTKLAESIPSAINGLGAIFGVPMPQSYQGAQLGTLGQEAETDEATNQADAPQPDNGTSLSVDHFLMDARRIIKAVPGIHINMLLKAIANLSESDPGQARNYMTMIISKHGKK